MNHKGKLSVNIRKASSKMSKDRQNADASIHGNKPRREFLRTLAGIPFLAMFPGALSHKPSTRRMMGVPDAGRDNTNQAEPVINGNLSSGKLGNLQVSRLILGCNLIGGWSHARDLIYTDKLFKTYHSEEKIIETFHIAEKAGINTVFMVTQYFPTLNKYKSQFNSKIQSVCQTMLPEKDFYSDINMAIDSGTTSLYIHGGEADKYISTGKIGMVIKAIEYIKSKGFMAGLGGHSLETIKACEREKMPADFYVKTFHHDAYWSAHPVSNREEYSIIHYPFSDDHNKYHDNMWDLFPDRTTEFMHGIKKPWIAFKVLAAGAIHPTKGFRFAFENGADFITVGMFDFQIAENVNTAIEVLNNLSARKRDWYS